MTTAALFTGLLMYLATPGSKAAMEARPNAADAMYVHTDAMLGCKPGWWVARGWNGREAHTRLGADRAFGAAVAGPLAIATLVHDAPLSAAPTLIGSGFGVRIGSTF